MALPKKIEVQKDLSFLTKLYKKSIPLIQPRIKMLIEIVKHQETGISKRDLAEHVGVNHNSIQTWRTMYLKGGLGLLCSHKMKGYKPSLINEHEHLKIKEKLSDPENGLQGYKELQSWLSEELNLEIKYSTLYNYCRTNFGTKIKVARKSHVNKDEKKVELFKKTLLIPVEQ
jgi:transposase